MVRTHHEMRARPARDAGPPASGRAMSARRLTLSKHEAAGNDFLVLMDLDGEWDLGPAEARWLCDRRLGIGADGLLVGRRADAAARGAAIAMVLYNADGSRAEMSGNGIRCLAQAAVLCGAVPRASQRASPARPPSSPVHVRVWTDAGLRTVELSDASAAVASASVDMGPVRLGEELSPSPVPGTRARSADVGNPHLVLVGDVALETLDLAALHREVTGFLGDAVNVEVARPEAAGALSLRVFERGVGETAACGTGSCAAAAVAAGFGLVGDVVAVANPGGELVVRLPADDGSPVVLVGPVRHVADVLVDPARLAPSVARLR